MSTEVLPDFQLIRPATVSEAVAALANPEAQICAGGTDVLVQLRMGLSNAATLIDITGIEALKTIEHTDKGSRIGAGVTLVELARDPHISSEFLSVAKAAASIAGPTHREVATVGGNLCLDTRCLYYNQSHWWRQANAFCLKYKGDICHVAPKGNRCRAAFSGELAPALMVHNASLEIIGPEGLRTLPLVDFYAEDGVEYINLKSDEIIVAVPIPPPHGPSDYQKVSVRSSLDFPLAGVAVAVEKVDETTHFKLAVTGTNSMPLLVDIPEMHAGDGEEFFTALEKLVQKAVSPQRTTTIAPHYRRLSISALAARLARELA